MPQRGATITERVSQSVAKSTNRDVQELPPLYEAVDPDALETLVGSMSSGRIEFTYSEQEIIIDSDGTISLNEQSSGHITPDMAVSSN